jgi:hypothetical protein
MFDQYRTKVRAKRKPVRIFTHFMTASVINAYLLAKSNGVNGINSLLNFYIQVIQGISTLAGVPATVSPQSQNSVNPVRKITWLKDSIRLYEQDQHYPCRLNSLENGRSPRGTCIVCSNKNCSTKCGYCDTWVCTSTASMSKNDCCYWRFHDLAADVDNIILIHTSCRGR